MKTFPFPAVFALAFTVASSVPAAQHPSLVSEVIATYKPVETDRSPDAIARAGNALLKALPEKRRAEASLPLDSSERVKWTNVPPRGPQGGVRLGDLEKENIRLACDLLNAVMTTQGYEKCRNIMLADDTLLRNGRPRAGFGAENFWLAVFGNPSADSPWAIQLDGHHLAVNITLSGENMSFSPTFIGTQPHTFPLGDEAIVPMKDEVGDAHAFAALLDEDQKKKAIIGDSRGSIQTAAGKDGVVPTPVGLRCDNLNDSQQEALLKLIAHWVNNLPKAIADVRMKEIASRLKDTHFAWNGPTAPGSDISYIIQGPTLIIEYACQDLGGEPLDHLHSMYRDPTNEYGKRIIGN